MQTSFREKHYRTSQLVCDTGNKVLQKLLTFHLEKNRGKITVSSFLAKYQHEIFHLYSNSQCCQCSNAPYGTLQLPLRRHQMELIFDEHNKKSCHGQQGRKVSFCCSTVKPSLRIEHLDITLLNSIFMNFCHDLFWSDCLMYQSLTEFLETNKHAIYHLWVQHGSCCRCQSKCQNNSSMIDFNHWTTLFNKCQSTNGCSLGDACSYTPHLTLTSQEIDNKLSSVLHNNFSDLRKAINQIVNYRNELVHTPIGNHLPAAISAGCEKHILVIANHIGADFQEIIKEEIAEQKSLKLDEGRYKEFMTTVKELKDQHEQSKREMHEELQEVKKELGIIYATVKEKKVHSLRFDHGDLNILDERIEDHYQQQKISDYRQAEEGSSLSWFCSLPFRLLSCFQGTYNASTEKYIVETYGDPGDTFECGPCNRLFNNLSDFLAHKKIHKTEGNIGEKAAFLITDVDEKWEDTTYNYSCTSRESLNVDDCELTGELTGSLIFLTKISSAMFRTEEVFLNMMQNFINNLLQKCPLENDGFTVLEIKIRIEDDFNSNDCFRCGLCEESFKSLSTFILHKESETHIAKKEYVDMQSEINEEYENNGMYFIQEEEEITASLEVSSDVLDNTVEVDILDTLGLVDYFPDKLTIDDVRLYYHDSSNKRITDIKWILISKLIGLNSKARDEELVPFVSTKNVEMNTTADQSDFSTFMNTLMENQFPSKATKDGTYNPLDIFLAVFCCCCPFLKQLIISKMVVCRLAVPLISSEWVYAGQPTIWTWPLRGIMVDGISSDGKTIQDSLLKSKVKTVSFIRLGSPSTSKSKLLNDILSNQYHDTFFNKSCPLGTTARVVSNGMIEATWFQPAKEERDIFKDIVMFLNLRGDGMEYTRQCDILQKISDVIVLILEPKTIASAQLVQICTNLQKSKVAIVYAIDRYDTNLSSSNQNIKSFMQKMKPFYQEMKLTSLDDKKGAAAIKEEMRKLIRISLKAKDKSSLEDKLVVLTPLNIIADESCLSCIKGKEKVDTIMKDIKGKSKKEIMPLQKPIWIEFTDLLKTQRKASTSFDLLKTDEIEQKLRCLREKQLSSCENLSAAIRMIIEILVELEDNSDEMQFFLNYLRSEMDDMSKKNIPELNRIYKTKWQIWQNSKGSKDSKKVNALKMDVDKAEQELTETPFGYEHLIRELGQIFECNETVGPVKNKSLKNLVPQCPRLVAKQLLLGQPFEIMDGDAANVPTIWINAVFQELEELIGNVKVLSISVLGIQSSGKSTLLNTMFGLQFAVSAGRCTRGVFLQLLSLPKGKYPFEYLLVIDTEGLRAPERSNVKYEHDNELATFVIGLGDVTIINVKGENTGEVKEVLEMAVHAFLRLKLTTKNNISLQQSCIFVHQNVPARDAKEKMMHGRKKFVEHLDLMTKQAAELENMPHISSFNEVMKFDSENHVFYFPDLWYGDPPMAPVNHGYSIEVENLKTFVFKEIEELRETFLTLSDTRHRLLDLWEGILTDDFVFSFRNTLEVKAYNSIEGTFQSLKWELEQTVFTFVNSFAENKFANCQKQKDCDRVYYDICNDLKQNIVREVQRLILIWKDMLNSSPWKEIVVQWKEAKINKLKLFASEQESQALQDLKTLKENYLIDIKNKQGLSDEDSRKCFNKANEVADRLKGKTVSHAQMTSAFDKMWKSVTDEYEHKLIVDVIPIERQIQNALLELNASDAVFLKDTLNISQKRSYKVLRQIKGSLTVDDIRDDFIGIPQFPLKNERHVMSAGNAKYASIYIINLIFEKLDVFISEKTKTNSKFNIHIVKQLFKTVNDEINKHNEKRDSPFIFLKPYKAFLQTHVGNYAEHVFHLMNQRYEETNGLRRKLNDYKTTLWEYFKARVEQRSEEVSAFKAFNKVIKEAVLNIVSKFLPMDVQTLILDDFAHTKFHLMMKILDTLAEEEDFDELYSYISHSKTYAQRWLENYSARRIFSPANDYEPSRYAILAKHRVNKIFDHIKTSLGKANIFRKTDISINMWLTHFIDSTEGCLPLSMGNFVHVRERNIPILTSFISFVESGFPVLQQECQDYFVNVTSLNVTWEGFNPYSSIFKKLWGCSHCCPFCREPCQKTDDGHFEADNADVHTCIQHRPVGVSGVHGSESLQMVIEVCNFKVQSDVHFECSASREACRKSGICTATDDETSHPYREYKTYIPSWDIAPSKNIHSSDFWSWFLCKNEKQLCEIYGIKSPKEIPQAWKSITKKKALQSLRLMLD